jgi:hypothetical protein
MTGVRRKCWVCDLIRGERKGWVCDMIRGERKGWVCDLIRGEEIEEEEHSGRRGEDGCRCKGRGMEVEGEIRDEEVEEVIIEIGVIEEMYEDIT